MKHILMTSEKVGKSRRETPYLSLRINVGYFVQNVRMSDDFSFTLFYRCIMYSTGSLSTEPWVRNCILPGYCRATSLKLLLLVQHFPAIGLPFVVGHEDSSV